MNRVLVSLQQRTDATLHPLLQVREVKRELVVVISTDKGLAGALNTICFARSGKLRPQQNGVLGCGA
jgi:F0F1-type ATP synthase gamma subunit